MDHDVNSLKSKLNQAMGILSHLKYNTSLLILKIVYHSFFRLHLQHGFQFWGQGNCTHIIAPESNLWGNYL